MAVEALRRLLSGCAAFTAAGGFPDLFLHECAKGGAVLENVQKGTASVSARAAEKYLPAVASAAQRSGMTLNVGRRYGLPPLLRRYRARVGIPIGLLVGALLLMLLSGRVWEVTVSGQRQIGREEITDALAELGVSPGARRAKIDAKETERRMIERLPLLSWISVNLIGCKAQVEVREIIVTPELTDEKDYANIVAAMDGVIVSADVLEGSGQPKVGDGVVRGDLLVSGIIEMNNGFQRFVNAKALIRAQTRTTLSVARPLTVEAEKLVKRRSWPVIRFFGITLPLGTALPSGETETDDVYMKSRKTVFPIGVRRADSFVFEAGSLTLSKEDASLVCFASFCEQAAQRYRKAELLRRELIFAVAGGEARVTATSDCVEEIGRRQPFSVEN